MERELRVRGGAREKEREKSSRSQAVSSNKQRVLDWMWRTGEGLCAFQFVGMGTNGDAGQNWQEVALAVADAHPSAFDLVSYSEDEAFAAFVRRTCEDLHAGKDTKATPTPSSHTDLAQLDFGLFTARPTLRALVGQSAPVVWLTLNAIWPELLAKFLQMIWCIPIPEESCVRQRLVPYPNVYCYSSQHLPLACAGFVGLVCWCIGIPLSLYLRIWRLRDRQDPECRRRYGFFMQGLDPGFWWWDLLVKRADIAIMLLVAYTSVANDEKAKLLIFALLSGLVLAMTSSFRPYANSQSQILDLLECSLLLARFILFSVVALLLIFFPSTEMTWVWAVLALVVLCWTGVFAALHIIAQVLRAVSSSTKVATSLASCSLVQLSCRVRAQCW